MGIVHFGTGGFHRAHQATYVDRLMNAGLAMDWGICGVGVMPGDMRMRDALKSQDCLYAGRQEPGRPLRRARRRLHRRLLVRAGRSPERVIELMAARRRASSR